MSPELAIQILDNLLARAPLNPAEVYAAREAFAVLRAAIATKPPGE